MKKIIFILFSIFVLFLPIKIGAVSITNTSINGKNDIKNGEDLILTFNIKFSESSFDENSIYGVGIIVYEIDFDEKLFTFDSVSAEGFESLIVKNDDYHYVTSIAKDINKSPCRTGILYCSDYSSTLKFSFKDSSVKEATISINAIEITLIDIENPEGGDLNLLEYNTKTTKNVKINNEKPLDTPPVSSKSNNSKLKELSIDGYNIDFSKDKKDYIIYINDYINRLTIKTDTDDSKAKYTITGDDDLKSSDYKVTILVTAQDGSTSTYTIKTEIKDNENGSSSYIKENNSDHKEILPIDKTTLIIGLIIIGIIFLVSILFLIIRKIKDHKVDKLLKHFESDDDL